MKTDLLHSAKRKQREAKLNSIKLQNIWKISKYSTKHDEVKINDMELNELTESTILPLTQNIVINSHDTEQTQKLNTLLSSINEPESLRKQK